MLVISPARSSERITLHADSFGRIISAVGTECYDEACFELLEQVLGVDHWALFQYPSNTSMSCLATASRSNVAEARANIEKFVGRCHSFDPSLAALKRRRLEQPCMVNIGIDDIEDRQYRQCFEATNVQERLSYFTRAFDSLYQLSIYRGPGRRAFSQPEMRMFATLGGLLMATALQHANRCGMTTRPTGPMTIDAIQRRLAALPGELSEREREVCARAIAGKTIEGTALDLNIRRTTVITYRERAYQKLHVSSLNELVALFHNTRPGAAEHWPAPSRDHSATERRQLHS
jgi:DNA-binding CsgD family transcriptional regulator